jgi:transcriptional regulator with XRE-family HTH domain
MHFPLIIPTIKLTMYNGEFLKKIRLLKGFNQNGIAKKMGISQQAYSKIEKNGAIDERKFRHIINAIGCSDKELEIVKNYPLPGKIAV